MSDVVVTLDIRVPMPDGFRSERIDRIVSSVLDAEGDDDTWDVAIAFVSDHDLQGMHREFMGDDTPTDIMTFPRETEGPWSGVPEPSGGDIAISVDRAAVQCVDGGWTVEAELEFLVIHGMLHLLGWDDATDEDRAAMLERQREILVSVTD